MTISTRRNIARVCEEKAMKNKLIDLNNHLFAQLERLSDEDIKGEQLEEEINRTKAIGRVSQSIIDNARLALDAQKAIGDSIRHLPEMIGE
jgi:rRNA maturation endonuclease Nob1